MGKIDGNSFGAPEFREQSEAPAAQPSGGHASFGGGAGETIISPSDRSALDATPQAYAPPGRYMPDNGEADANPHYDHVGGPPAATDYYGGQGYRVMRDANGRPPSSNYLKAVDAGRPPAPDIAPESAPTKGRSLLDPDSSTRPRRLETADQPRSSHKFPVRGVAAAGVAAVLFAGIAEGVIQPGRSRSVATGPINNIFDSAGAELRVRQEYFDQKPLIEAGNDPMACLEHSDYEGNGPTDIGDMDADIRTTRNVWGRRHQDITVTVEQLDGEGPKLVFERVHTFPFDKYAPADTYTKKTVADYPCDPPAKPAPTGEQTKPKGAK